MEKACPRHSSVSVVEGLLGICLHMLLGYLGIKIIANTCVRRPGKPGGPKAAHRRRRQANSATPLSRASRGGVPGIPGEVIGVVLFGSPTGLGRKFPLQGAGGKETDVATLESP